MQTFIAFIVVISYYIEYRANLKFTCQMNSENITIDSENFGLNKGS